MTVIQWWLVLLMLDFFILRWNSSSFESRGKRLNATVDRNSGIYGGINVVYERKKRGKGTESGPTRRKEAFGTIGKLYSLSQYTGRVIRCKWNCGTWTLRIGQDKCHFAYGLLWNAWKRSIPPVYPVVLVFHGYYAHRDRPEASFSTDIFVDSVWNTWKHFLHFVSRMDYRWG